MGHSSRPPLTGRSALAPSCLIVLFLCLPGLAVAQKTGDEAELDRLKTKAEDAMANDDAEGAAMAMGRAALMAAHLAKKQTEAARARLFQGIEHLSRSQEHGYRAMALFRRAGGTYPASAGVCSSLQLGQLELQHAKTSLDKLVSPPDGAERSSSTRLAELLQNTEEWSTVLAAMQTDYQCPQ
jgi:hypothetical protein